MEQGERETAGITRSQNAVHVLPEDWSAIPALLATPLERLDAESTDLQVLIVTADSEAAAAVAGSLVGSVDHHPISVAAATGSPRTERVLKARPAHIVVGTPADLIALLKHSAIKLDALKAIVLAWADGADDEALGTLMAEVPKEAARVIVVQAISPAVEALVERYARRARRVSAAEPEGQEAITLEYATVSPVSRPGTLRRLLDALDPDKAAVVVRSDASERAARDVVRSLGYDDKTVRVVREGEVGKAKLVVVYDVPVSGADLRAALGESEARVIVLAQPRQIESLRAIAAGGAVTPFTLPDAGAKARDRDARAMAELRDVLASGRFSREVKALESLLDDFDGVEIAAAALVLLERERANARPTATQTAAATSTTSRGLAVQPRASAGGEMQRVFVSIGEMENVRPADLVGAILNETGLPKESLGKIDIRETHSLVEVAGGDAEMVAEKLTGMTLKGRRLTARIDKGAPAREGREGRERAPRDRAPRDRAPRERGERPARGGFSRGERSERPARGGFDRGERGERPSRGGFDRGERGERPSRGGFDRGERSERPARGGYPRGERSERPARGGFDRDERPRSRAPREGGFKPREGGFKPREGGFKPREDRGAPRGGRRRDRE